MTDWISLADETPKGDGQIIVWCRRTDWIRLVVASTCRPHKGVWHFNDCVYTHFAYFSHPFEIPYEASFSSIVQEHPITLEQVAWLEEHIGPRIAKYDDFVNIPVSFFAGQDNPDRKHRKHFFKQPWRILFHTEADMILAHIGMPKGE